MAITTVDGCIAGMQPPQAIAKGLTGTVVAGRHHSLFYLAGLPGAAAIPSPGVGGTNLTTYPGQIPFTNPVSGNTYLARVQAMCTQPGSLWLCDRLWHNSGLSTTITTEQLCTGATQILARDANGSNAGVGVYAAVEVTGATGSGTPTLTVKYNNQVGTQNQVGTNIVATVASSIAGTFHVIGLAAGDTGVRLVQSLTLSATWTSGTISVVLFRPIAMLELTAANVPNAIDALTAGFVRLYDNSVPFLVFVPSTTTTSNISGHVIVSQG